MTDDTINKSYVEIEWTSDSKEVPDYGLCEKGKVFSVVDSDASDLIKRGFAKIKTTKVSSGS